MRFWDVEFRGCMSTGTGFRVQGEEFTGYLGLLDFGQGVKRLRLSMQGLEFRLWGVWPGCRVCRA